MATHDRNPDKKALGLTKAQQRLHARQEDYTAICRERSDNGQGFKRPGSMNPKK